MKNWGGMQENNILWPSPAKYGSIDTQPEMTKKIEFLEKNVKIINVPWYVLEDREKHKYN